MTDKRVGRVISNMGKRANVVVDKSTGKQATAHGFRRAFGTRWSRQVKPVTLKALMRHETIETTMSYYVDDDVKAIATELW